MLVITASAAASKTCRAHHVSPTRALAETTSSKLNTRIVSKIKMKRRIATVLTFFAQSFWLIESFLTSLGICDGLKICFGELRCWCNGTLEEMFSSMELMGVADESVSVTLSFKISCFSWQTLWSGNKAKTQLNRSLLVLQFFFFLLAEEKIRQLIDWCIFILLSRESICDAILWRNTHTLWSWPFFHVFWVIFDFFPRKHAAGSKPKSKDNHPKASYPRMQQCD